MPERHSGFVLHRCGRRLRAPKQIRTPSSSLGSAQLAHDAIVRGAVRLRDRAVSLPAKHRVVSGR